MNNWDKLRSRLKETNRDLDKEFEQFLNESLSDQDSVSSPRNKSPDLKRKDFSKAAEASKHWWESSVEDESSKDTVAQSWFKTTAPVKEEEDKIDEEEEIDKEEEIDEEEIVEEKEIDKEEEIDEEEIVEEEEIDKEEEIDEEEIVEEEEIDKDNPKPRKNVSDENIESVTKVETKAEVPQDIGVSVTMSKDSLDDGTGVNSEKENASDSERPDAVDKPTSEEDEEDYSYTEPTGTPTSTPNSPRREIHEGMKEDEFEENTETGMNTQKELEEKREFFEKLEEENKSNLDYGKLNEMLDEETSATDQGRTGDFLQTTGAELGNSIFNTTGFAGGSDVTISHKKEPTSQSPKKNSSKPSMLSKVSLMDSLESSMDTAHQEKLKGIRQKQIDLPAARGKESRLFQDPIDEDEEYSVSVETGAEDGRLDVVTTEGVGTGFLNTSAANELAALQEALRAAHMVGTNDSRNLGFQDIQSARKTMDDTAPNETEVKTDQNRTRLAKASPSPSPSPSNIVHEINHLRPVIVTSEETQGVSYTTSVSNPQLNQTLPLPSDMNAAPREQLGIILPRNTNEEHLKPVLGNQDIFQARQTAFSAYLSRDFVLPVSERAEPLVQDKRGLSHGDVSSHIKDRQSDGHRKVLGGSEGVRLPDYHGFDLEPVASPLHPSKTGSSEEDTPPPESLKGIKSIVKKRREAENKPRSAGNARDARNSPSKARSKTSRSGKIPARVKENVERRGMTKQEVPVGDRSRFGWRNTPDGTATRGKRGIIGKERKEKREKTPKKQPNVVHESSPAKRSASVQSFAKYFKNTFVHDEGNGNQVWDHEYEDNRSADESLASNRMSREQALRKEVEHWRTMWHDERKQCENLVHELAEKDKEWKRREQTLKLDYNTQINDLKQKVFVLESRLKDVKVEMNSRKRVAKGGSLKGMSDEELRKLEKEVREQDQLLTGYQQENERLYGDLKDAQVKSKTAESQMFKENQKLATEVAALKEKLERKGGIFEAAGAASLGAERIHQLHSQVQLLKSNEKEMRKEIDDLENERRELQKKVKNLERERDTSVQRTNELLGTNTQTLQDIESTHAANVERLNRKLKWYAENQDLLDKDTASLKQKDEEIQELRELVNRLEAERGKTTLEKDKKEKERALDAKRVQDLERQVREMESIIKRRYPNSIPAMIYAASAAPGDGKPLKSDGSPKKSNTPSYSFLENRVKRLERELEEREEEWGRSFRVLEQKYNGMQLEYEGQVKDIRRDLSDARERVTSHTHTRAHTTSLEKELDTTREKNERETLKLQTQINVLREALRASKTEEAKVGKTKQGKRDSRGSQRSRRIEEELESRLRSLREECEEKDGVVKELKSTCAQLQRQREEMLADKASLVTHKNLQERLDVVNSEKHQLRDQLSQMSVELDQQRVRYQGSLAEVERMARQEREASHDELSSLRTQHKKELESAKEEHALQHSRSKMAEMSNKMASLEIVIERLKDKLTKSAETEVELASKKVHEEVLKQEINQLRSDLKKAKQFHTPQMQHYSQLEDKIAAMETRHRQREHELKAVIHKTKLTADVEKDEVLDKWRKLLRKKTEETERFRVELDGILTVLEELRQQGVVIPGNKTTRLHCS